VRPWWPLLLVPLVVASWQGYQLVQLRMPLPQSVVERAFAGVEANEQWDPIRRDHAARPMALVPAGCFPMGTSAEQLREASYWCDRFFGVFGCPDDFSNEQPVHEVCFERPFWIDVYEVTNLSYGSLYPAGMTPTDPLYIQYQWPRGTVSWEEAEAHCRGRGARLPTEAEWEYAARGPDALIYPWGNSFDPSEVDWYSGHPYRVGSKAGWVSWVGAHDMAAGMAEWVNDAYGPYATEAGAAPAEGTPGGQRVARGGHWFSRSAYHWRTSARAPYPVGYASSTVGFRCAVDQP